MESQAYRELELGELVPNAWNPKEGRCEGPDFEEMVQSVREKGVLEPILARPIEEDPPLFEIVAGERRFRALERVASENGGPEGWKIPAMVRKLTDDEAFEITMIENLQRKDLTELQEAESFKVYLDRKGMDCLPELAERTGINPRYIRRRVAVLDLPKKTLKAWDKGELSFGHLEQLIRLKDKKKILEYTQNIVEWRGAMTVKELKEKVDNKAPKLKWAKFDTEKAGCTSCAQNSEVQKKLFGSLAEISEVRCLNPGCFKKNQNNWLLKNWKKTGYRKQYGTNGFRFKENVSYDEYRDFFFFKPGEQCKDCPEFITLINLDGTVREGQACIGNKDCFNKLQNKAAKRGNGRKGSEAGSQDRPRPAWHGEYFREKFYKEQIPMKFEELAPENEKTARFILMSLLQSNGRLLHGWFGIKHGVEEAREIAEDEPERLQWWVMDEGEVARIVLNMTMPEVTADLKEAALMVILHDFGPDGRQAVANHIGIDLGKEWRLNKEYLGKKTIKELLALGGEELDIFNQKEAQTYLYEVLNKKRGNFKSCKKDELIRIFLESGADLTGRVPKEILG